MKLGKAVAAGVATDDSVDTEMFEPVPPSEMVENTEAVPETVGSATAR